MLRKLVPTLLLLVIIGAGLVAWLRIGSAEECEGWAAASLKKARASYDVLISPANSFPEYLRMTFERTSFQIDDKVYRNPGGCHEGLLPARPQANPTERRT